jgi:hypothetical protein
VKYKYKHKMFWPLGIEIRDLNQVRLSCLSAFFCTFFVKKHVETKRWHQIKKFKRQYVPNEISDLRCQFKDFEIFWR